MMRVTGIVLLVASLAAPAQVFAAAAAPEVLWVDKATGDDFYSGDEGTLGDVDHPFASIQAAVNAAKDGDTIKVLPGDYDNGGYVDGNGHSNRVYIAKKIHLVSTEGAWQTTIRGKFDSGDTANDGTNLAGDGVRCVRVYNTSNKKNGYGAVVEGFTLVDGYAADTHAYGGAIRAESPSGAYFVDCTITNCTGTMKNAGSNGAIRGGTLVRCEVLNCSAWSTLYTANAWNCVFSGNSGIRGVLATSTAVNCSFYGNDEGMDYFSFQTCQIYNSAIISYPKYKNHYYTSATLVTNTVDYRTGVFVDAANGDWTLTAGSPAIGIADAAILTNVIKLTEAEFPIELLDFYWNPLPTEGVISAGAVQDVRPADTWWVDRARGDDDYAGNDLGDMNHPFASIQAAVENAVDGDTIKVLPGDYDNGGYVDDTGHSNRVYIAKRLHIVSTGGAAVTTIRGRHDTGDAANDGTNLAGDGVRCVRAASHINNKQDYYGVLAHGTVIEGFTLADGYGAQSQGFGGAFKTSQNQYGVFLVDCVVTNCTGTSMVDNANGVVVGGALIRCAVLDSPETWAVIVASKAWNSVFSGNVTVDGKGLLAKSVAVNCSLANNDGSNIHVGGIDTGGLYGLVSVGARPAAYYNSRVPVVNSLKGLSSAFVDSANGDWRLLPDSAAIGLADAADYTNAVDFAAAAFPIAYTDFYGNAMPTEGNINAGAVQVVAPRMYIASPRFGGATVTGCAQFDATNYVALSGASAIEIAIDPSSALRPLAAVVTNGVVVPIASVPAAFTITPSEDSGALTSVEWVYKSDWYVNEKAGSDANDGFTPETPFATLAMASTNAMLMAGDVIHVAEGVYSTGVVAPAAGKTIGARAYVKSGVTLVADGAKERTLIVGAEATGDNIEETKYNSGFDAVRCVYLEDNATVRGFTICGGRTRAYGNGAQSSNVDFDGGGVCGPKDDKKLHTTRLVENCVITNCAAAWGGGAFAVMLRRCDIHSCGYTRNGAASYYASHESCRIRNFMFYPYALVNTTVYMDAGAGACYSNDCMPPTNCLFLAKVPPNERTKAAVNCIFQKHTSTGSILMPSNLPPDSTSMFVDSIAALSVDADYRPTKNSPLVDFSPQLGALTSDIDLDGNPRVLNNGRVDCGCYEYDWRRDYAADIGAKGLSVVAASPDVVETNGVVRLVDGCELVMCWKLRSTARRTFPVVVSGAGTLSAYVNGALVATLTAADSSFAWDGAAGTDEIRLVFSDDGYAETGCPKSAAGTFLLLR